MCVSESPGARRERRLFRERWVAATIHIELESGETKEFRLDRDVVIGRGEGCDIVVDDEFASDRHATISVEGSAVWVEDLGSTNGTAVAGTRISGRVRIEPGATITVGRTKMVLR